MYNLADVSGRCSKENDHSTEMICKLLHGQAAPHVEIEKFDGDLKLSVLHVNIKGGSQRQN